MKEPATKKEAELKAQVVDRDKIIRLLFRCVDETEIFNSIMESPEVYHASGDMVEEAKKIMGQITAVMKTMNGQRQGPRVKGQKGQKP